MSSVVRDTPNYADPGYVWASLPDCPGAASAPAVFYRGSLAVGQPRAIHLVNPSRPAGTCNPYRLLSDIVTDGTWIYFIDNQGASGTSALWRRRRDANPEDASQLLNSLSGYQLAGAELIHLQGVLFAILHLSNVDLDILVEYDKTTGALLNGGVEYASRYALGNMQYDGQPFRRGCGGGCPAHARRRRLADRERVGRAREAHGAGSASSSAPAPLPT